MSETLLVCRGCGVEHGYDCSQPIPTFLQKLFQTRLISTYRLRAQAKPMIDPTSDLPAGNYFADGWVNVSVIDETPVVELKCLHCHQTGMLTDAWPEGGAPCPNCCDGMILKSSSRWMT